MRPPQPRPRDDERCGSHQNDEQRLPRPPAGDALTRITLRGYGYVRDFLRKEYEAGSRHFRSAEYFQAHLAEPHHLRPQPAVPLIVRQQVAANLAQIHSNNVTRL